MTITTISSREFNQDTSRAKKAANDGPVFITDRGRPAHVLLSIEEYHRLAGTEPTIGELLSWQGDPDFEFEFPRLDGEYFRAPDLSGFICSIRTFCPSSGRSLAGGRTGA